MHRIRGARTCITGARTGGRLTETEAEHHAEDAVLDPVLVAVVVRVDVADAVRIARFDQRAAEHEAGAPDEPEVPRVDGVIDVGGPLLALERCLRASRQ